MSERKTIGGIPVECLTGQPAAIWSGWRTLGDRELVREASAKGTHIKLAHTCLAYRRNCSVEQASAYFNKEVEVWIDELLNKKQVYRASHVLKNVGKDPVEHIFAVATKSRDPLLRDYLCEYMIKICGFDTEHVAAWNIVKRITQYEKKHEVQSGLSSSVSIDNIVKLPQHIKQALCTELYYSLNEPDILEYVSGTNLWDYLLCNNKIHELKLWIDTKYNPDAVQSSDEIDPHLKTLFVNFDITSDMIEYIDSSNASDLVKDLTKNHLCKYGIFVKEEVNDFKRTLSRFFSSGITLEKFDATLSLGSSNINKLEFLQTVDQQLCLMHCAQECRTQEDNTKLTKLFNVLTDMCNAEDCHEDALARGIVESIDYLSDDINTYLRENYLVNLTLIFLRLWQMRGISCKESSTLEEHKLLRDIFRNEDGLEINKRIISQDVLQLTLAQVPILRCIIEDQTNKDTITMYELLDGYKNLNTKLLFKWRFKDEAMPTFANENLIKKYGYKETLTYGYYLKEGRPNVAVHSFKHAQAKLFGNVSSRRKFKAALYAHILALRNLDKLDIVCSCIAFIELLEIDSSNLRLHVTVARYVQEELNVFIGNLLENVVYKNQNDLISVISYLEQSFQKLLSDETLMNDSAQFVKVLKTWDIIVRFARVHNCALPSTLLKYLASRDLWFEYVVVSDIFAYPTKQVLENVKLFNNSSIREHLLTCLNNSRLKKSSQCNEQKLRFRDTRQLLYNKIEVKRNESSTSVSPMSEINAGSSGGTNVEHISNSSSTSSDNNLWLTILNCHRSQDPPGMLINASHSNLRPVLTILATCYEPSSVAAYCYCWMVISAGREDMLLNYTECLEQQIWPPRKIADLLDKMIEYGYINTLNRAYQIFMPDSILNSFFEFLAQAITYGEFKESQRHLLEFKSQCSSLKCNKIMDWTSADLTYLKNLYWIAIVATRCIVIALGYGFQSTSLQMKLLETLIRCNFSADLPVTIPDFQCLLDITKILQKTDITLNFTAITVVDNVHNFDTEIQRCINDLVAIGDYSTALELSCTAGLDSSKIILAQSRDSFKGSINKDGQVNSAFWMQCAQDFNKFNVPPQIAIEFFVEHAEKVTSHKERYEILKLAYETSKNTEIEQQTIDTVEMAMWKSCILAGPENIQFDCNDCIFNKLKTELLSDLDNLQVTCSLTDKNEKESAEALINKLIDLGKLDIALRISVIFNYNHRDLQILMLCLSLAEGEISPAKLTTQQRSLLEETNKNKQQKYGALRNRGLQRFSSSSSLNSVGESSKPNDTKITSDHQLQMECISTLEKLSEILKHGNEIYLRIVSCYKLAVHLKKSYQSLLMLSNPIKFLQEIIESNIENKFETANNIITSYKIKTESIATFLTENIMTHIACAIEDGQEDLICMWGYPLNTHFHLIMELCSDISLLGSKLLRMAQSLLAKHVQSHDEKKNVSTLKKMVELLIRSHDCFTASCNMEGIASVLRKCQNLANTLQILKHWAILVRLVTGVGRFTEMNYIFQILKENDHFEFLLGKGLDKIPGLKMALLEFLKRQCPEDKELFTLVALHFRLYYEIALMWENEAKEIVTRLISNALKDCGKGATDIPVEIKLIRNDYIQKQLQLVVTNFTHATQYYLQDNKLNLASRCSHQAELVALQISLLNTVPQNQLTVCLLNLKGDEIDKISSQVLSFPQTLIVTRAYNYHVDWANLIYHHCVLKGEIKYLKEFMTVNSLTPTIVQDCARRYRLEKSINHFMMNNMRTLVSELSNIECKYMLASQLGFKNVVEEMLNDPAVGSYLKDTIWKKGYNTP